ncbi:YciI family protein [Flavobacterium microcysteis]|uniref:YCII-related domain-containing protein n=1 Tax=Flavobacterium microcysteis TaxID=2596891 RepID=A0A501Q0S0_9FLAO|nr:YciI family protein [Flavobacterium microcysteis]TPD65902.1 hypothetical protein FJA49_17130 [Flavobacterium microcysteis]
MKKLLLILMLACFFKANAQIENPNYDSKLAESLGGDDYGMKMYVLAILKTGSNNVEDKEKLNTLFRGHMDNITRLAKEGKLIVAGPLSKNDKNYRGIFILNVKTIEEANQLLNTDPAIKEKVFDVETFQWYGSAALPEYLKTHEKIEKKKH